MHSAYCSPVFTRPWLCYTLILLNNEIFLFICDAHFKWIEVLKMNSTTATVTIKVLRTTFTCYRLPESIIFDNGPQFCLSEFAKLCH